MKKSLSAVFIWIARRRFSYIFLHLLPDNIFVDLDSRRDPLKRVIGLIFMKLARFSRYGQTIRRNVFFTFSNHTDKPLHLVLNVNEFTQCGYYFSDLDASLVRLIKQGGSTFIDVGANIGLYSLIATKSFSHVYSFEPSNFTYEILTRNIQINASQSIVAVNSALSDVSSESVLYVNPLNNGGASLAEFSQLTISRFSEYEWGKINVRLEPLDSFVQALSIKNVDLIKIDVEGHERPVVRGARKTILHYRPLIFAEISSNRRKLAELLEELPADYVAYSLNQKCKISCNDKLPQDILLCPNEKMNLIASV